MVLWVGVIAILFIAGWLLLAFNCPDTGLALTSNARNLHRLKNRTALPRESDFDPSITLDELLRSGDDKNRWSTSRAARIQAQVLDVAYARPEATNCFNPCRRDIHIVLGKRDGAPKTEQMILEITPKFREWATTQEIDWSEQTLHAQLVGHWCEFEGWMYFDLDHGKESENTAPGNAENWRATAWEIHPVTKITVMR